MKRNRWKAAEAKAHFSQVLRDAQQEPQIIENRGRKVAVVLAMEEYAALRKSRSQSEPGARLAEFLRFSAELRREDSPELVILPRHNRPGPILEDESCI